MSHSESKVVVEVKDESVLSGDQTMLMLPKPTLAKPDTGSFIDSVISDIEGPDHFYAQPIAYESIAEKLSQSLNAFYSMFAEDETKISAQFLLIPGGLCVAKWAEDKRWYRAKYIKRESPAKIRVNFIDYGNEATVSIRNVKTMIDYFQKCLPPLAMRCCDSIAAKIDPSIFKAKLEARSCVIKVDSVSEDGTVLCTVWKVKQNEEVNMSEMLAELSLKKKTP